MIKKNERIAKIQHNMGPRQLSTLLKGMPDRAAQ